ncbi:MAG: hypothetical protein JST33_07585 [Actinobacteria bacterium]|nr:hypothetical protein [Actinomycetota bacterium]
MAHIVESARGALLFSDGDSMLPLLMARSLDVGQPQDWAMSSVLFLPEMALFLGVWLLRLGPDGTMILNGCLTLLALYLALRAVAGSWFRSSRGVVGALLSFACFGLLAGLDHTASRDSLELASLLTTPTYYAATVIALVLSIALLRAMTGSGRRTVFAGCALGFIAALSTLSNPLYLIWATGPLGIVLVVLWVRRRADRRSALLAAAVLAGASLLGYLLRIPFARFIANDGLGYIDLRAAGASAAYYLGLARDMVATPAGAVTVGAMVLLPVLFLVLTVRERRRGESRTLLVLLGGWVIPVTVLAVAVLLGTHAARYLQPLVYAPLAAITVLPALLPRGFGARVRPLPLLAVLGVLGVLGAAAATPLLVRAADRPDPDLACVTGWVDRSGAVGAGQFWTIRSPKTRVADPRALVQVDAQLRPYEWLVNRDDSRAGAVSFLVVDRNSVPFGLGGARADAEISCGRYRILDFRHDPLPLGPPRS